MIYVFYGPKVFFESNLPKRKEKTTLIELAVISDASRRVQTVIHKGIRSSEEEISEETPPIKKVIKCLVAYSDDYSGISENAIQSFFSFLSEFDIKDIYLQNPPIYIIEQMQKLGLKFQVNSYEYNSMSIDSLKRIDKEYDNRIIGQNMVKQQLLSALYPLVMNRVSKPLVILFYGPTGVGKTETAKFLSELMAADLFRKQFSMFQSNDFATYLFGGKHSQNCFARELLERESNIILLDEFDKPNPVFHSAFYQLFDEGIYDDKNYHVEVRNAIIICTSNYLSEDDIKSKLGAPIYSRFDEIIKYNDISEDGIKRIIKIEFDKQYSLLTLSEQEIVDNNNVLVRILTNASYLKNARDIRKVIRQAISTSILSQIL